MLERFSPFLPNDVTLLEEKLGHLYWAKVQSQGQIIGHALEADQRTAGLVALGNAVASTWPNSRRGDPLDLSWAFGVAEESARQRSIQLGVRRWVWATWMEKSLSLKEAPQLAQEIAGFNALGQGPLRAITCWQTPLSFFEPNSAIHHFHFTVVVAQTQGGSIIGSSVSRQHESPVTLIWLEFLQHLAFLRDSESVRVPENYKRRLLKARGVDLKAALAAWQGEGEWPPFRMDQSFGVELKNLGLLWATRVEGMGDLIKNSGDLVFCE